MTNNKNRNWNSTAAGWKKWHVISERAARTATETMLEMAGVSKGDIVIDIGVEMPSEEILIKVKSISNIVSERQDRVKLAIFNLEFSQRISSYKTTVQKTNDVYTLAAKIFFKDSLVGKYDGLSEGIISLISDTTTNDDHALSQEEKTELSKKFSGLAWSFWQTLQ